MLPTLLFTASQIHTGLCSIIWWYSCLALLPKQVIMQSHRPTSTVCSLVCSRLHPDFKLSYKIVQILILSTNGIKVLVLQKPTIHCKMFEWAKWKSSENCLRIWISWLRKLVRMQVNLTAPNQISLLSFVICSIRIVKTVCRKICRPV